MYPSEGRKWAALAGMVLTAAVIGILWHLVGGCESEPPDPTAPSAGILGRARALRDENVQELTVQVAWYVASQGTLPADRAALEAAKRPPGWPPPPETTLDGRALAYEPAGDRVFRISLADPDGPEGPAGPIEIELKVPDPMPSSVPADAFKAWWDLHLMRAAIKPLQGDPGKK